MRSLRRCIRIRRCPKRSWKRRGARRVAPSISSTDFAVIFDNQSDDNKAVGLRRRGRALMRFGWVHLSTLLLVGVLFAGSNVAAQRAPTTRQVLINRLELLTP